MYAELLDTLTDEERGKIMRRMCEYMFGDVAPDELTDKKLRFLWGNIIDCLETDKQAQSLCKTPKRLNRQMPHFTFYQNFYEAMELMDDKQSGQYLGERLPHSAYRDCKSLYQILTHYKEIMGG